MKKIILHLGMHKTASSSFQQYCFDNRDSLAAHNISYPVFQPRSNVFNPQRGVFNHSGIIRFCFSSKRSDLYNHLNMEKDQVRDYFLDTLSRHLESDQDVVISGEGICLLEQEELEIFKQYLLSFKRSLGAFALVRSPYSYMTSSVQQKIKAGTHVDFVDFHGEKAVYSLPSDVIKKILAVFGKEIFIKSFSEACTYEGGPVSFLLENMAIPYSDSVNVHTNEGIYNNQVRRLNEILKSNPNMNREERNAYIDSVKLPNDVKFKLTKEEYLSNKFWISSENKIYSEMLGPDFCDEKILLL